MIVIIPFLAALLWLLSIRPYCRRNGKGFTPGAAIGVTFWVDWQEAGEIAKSKGDDGMILVCRFVFWLHIIGFCTLAFAVLRPLFQN
ncbi:MAG: hypothetical protein ABIT37_02425 [Luteolibacter sp.]